AAYGRRAGAVRRPSGPGVVDGLLGLAIVGGARGDHRADAIQRGGHVGQALAPLLDPLLVAVRGGAGPVALEGAQVGLQLREHLADVPEPGGDLLLHAVEVTGGDLDGVDLHHAPFVPSPKGRRMRSSAAPSSAKLSFNSVKRAPWVRWSSSRI